MVNGSLVSPGPTPTDTGFVYALVHPAFPTTVKIGWTRDLTRRLTQANTWCPGGGFRVGWAVRVRQPKAVESVVHVSQSQRRLSGEWFALTLPDARTAIEHAVESLRAEL